MKVSIEEKSGFCYGVVRAVEMADSILEKGEALYCLGQIVHNEMEVKRLEEKGMITISRDELPAYRNCKMLIRAHGEPPSTYEIARKNNIEIIDGTCPIVRKIQSGISAKSAEKDVRILIFGKKGHPEVEGLYGQSPEKSFVISSVEEARNTQVASILHLYSQTTMDTDAFAAVVSILEGRLQQAGGSLVVHNTICGHVSHRRPGLKKFALENDMVIFVGGKHSSNGKVLFEVCREANPRSFYVGEPEELEKSWFKDVETVGLTGATSTPRWQIDLVAERIRGF